MNKGKIHILAIYGYSEYQHRVLKATASANGMSLSDFMRKCIAIGYESIMKKTLAETARNYQKAENENE